MTLIELNCDLGELGGVAGLEHDCLILPWIDRANVACGGHAGDPDRMRQIALACRQQDVAFGAHPGYPDREAFGRRVLPMSDTRLFETLCEQILLAKRIADAAGIPLSHVKPHGALYNLAAENRRTADIIVRAILELCPTAKLVGLSGSQFISIADASGLSTISEAFADRGYHANGCLVSRQHPSAVLDDPDRIVERVRQMRDSQTIISVEGTSVPLRVETVCVHSDTANAVAIARRIRETLGWGRRFPRNDSSAAGTN